MGTVVIITFSAILNIINTMLVKDKNRFSSSN
jgi:hypothetical protein